MNHNHKIKRARPPQIAMNILDLKKLKLFIKDRKPIKVSAGILNDWFMTAAVVYDNGKWIKNNEAYTTSFWGTPGFIAAMENGDVIEVVAYNKKRRKYVA
jgi:hypothetical protein